MLALIMFFFKFPESQSSHLMMKTATRLKIRTMNLRVPAKTCKSMKAPAMKKTIAATLSLIVAKSKAIAAIWKLIAASPKMIAATWKLIAAKSKINAAI